jgi:hypothetical protein
MSSDVIADNWALQDISRLLTRGMDDDIAHLVEPDVEKGSHQYKEIAAAIIQTEALFDFLTDVILRDQIVVEENNVSAWREESGPLEAINKAKVIRAYAFRDNFKLNAPRTELVNRLCITESLRAEHEENTKGWAQYRQTPNPYLSQILWGGAGMLARAFVTERSYTPHPVRRNFFQQAGVVLRSEDALRRLTSQIREKRASIYKAQSGKDEFYSLYVSMDPLPIRVLQESNSVDDLLTIALQLRDEYRELRHWLGCYQAAINQDEYSEVEKYQDILRSISRYVDSGMGKVDANAPTYTVGIGALKIAMKGDPVNALKNQFGVRAMVNKLIMSKSGVADLKKYLGLFGEKNSAVGMKVLEHFSETAKA